MKITKKIFVLLFAFVTVLFAAFAIKANVNALDEVATSDKIQVLGAGIRTTGNAGIRFVGSVEGYEAPTEKTIKAYGIAIAYGNAEYNDSFVKGGTVNEKEVLYAESSSLDEGNNFFIVLYGVPEDSYAQNVTARAYVVLDDETIVYGVNNDMFNKEEKVIRG